MEYAIIEKGQNEWAVIDENEEVVDIITKDMIVGICEQELKRCFLDVLDMAVFIENVWYLLNKGDKVNINTQDYDKFDAWFDYVCAECFGNGIINYFKQRLLDFE